MAKNGHFCSFCKIWTTSEKFWSDHLAGKKHKCYEASGGDPIEERNTMFYCRLCGVEVPRSDLNIRQHIGGKWHKQEEKASNEHPVTNSKETRAPLKPASSDTQKQQPDKNRTAIEVEATTELEEAAARSSEQSSTDNENEKRTKEEQTAQPCSQDTSPTGKVSDLSSSAFKSTSDSLRNGKISSSFTSRVPTTGVSSKPSAAIVTSATYVAKTKDLASKENTKSSELANTHPLSSSISAAILVTDVSKSKPVSSEAEEKQSEISVGHSTGITHKRNESCQDEDISQSLPVANQGLALPRLNISTPPSGNVCVSKTHNIVEKELAVSSVPNRYSSSDSNSSLAAETSAKVPSKSKHVPETFESAATYIKISSVSSSSGNSVAVGSPVTTMTAPILASDIGRTHDKDESQSLSSTRAKIRKNEAAPDKSDSKVPREAPQASSEEAIQALVPYSKESRTETTVPDELNSAAESPPEQLTTESLVDITSGSDKFYTPSTSPVPIRATSHKDKISSASQKASAKVCENVEQTTNASPLPCSQFPSATSASSELHKPVNAEASSKIPLHANASTQTSIASVPSSTVRELPETTNTSDKMNSKDKTPKEDGQSRSEYSGNSTKMPREETGTSCEGTSEVQQQFSQGLLPSLTPGATAHAQNFTSRTPEPPKKVELRVVRGPYYRATFHWNVAKKQDKMTSYHISLAARASGRELFMDSLPSSSQLTVPIRLAAGEDYTARVRAIRGCVSQGQTFYETIADSGPVPFRAVYSRRELQLLQDKAEAYMRANDRGESSISFFYRDKPYPYWIRVSQNNNVMSVYTKDRHGDQASPINESLSGLFFNVNVRKSTGMPPAESLFGDHRLYIPTSDLFGANHNLYFADFYCVTYSHYVTLVIAPKDTPNDRLCKELQLPELDKRNNKFLFFKATGGVFAATASPTVWIEVLYAGSLTLPPLFMNDLIRCETVGSGRSNPPGKPKSTTCKICNIYLPDK